MIKTVRKVGNGNAIPLDKGVMELLNLRTGSQVQLTVTGNQIVITPTNVGLTRVQVDQSVDKFFRRYGKAFRELAK